MNTGKLITFEGIDGAGKTTQLRILAEALRKRGYHVETIREPGGTVLSEKIRDLLLDARHGKVSPAAEALLYAAARAQLVFEVLNPLLAQGTIVLADRFTDSTLAYQGYGRGMDINQLRQLNRLATGGLEPDLTLVLDISPLSAAARKSGESPDRLEQEGLLFQEKVRAGYLALVKESTRFRVIEAESPPEQVAARVLETVLEYLGGHRDG